MSLNSQMALKALSRYKNVGLEVLLLRSFRSCVYPSYTHVSKLFMPGLRILKQQRQNLPERT